MTIDIVHSSLIMSKNKLHPNRILLELICILDDIVSFVLFRIELRGETGVIREFEAIQCVCGWDGCFLEEVRDGDNKSGDRWGGECDLVDKRVDIKGVYGGGDGNYVLVERVEWWDE